MAIASCLVDTNILLRMTRRSDPQHQIVDTALARLCHRSMALWGASLFLSEIVIAVSISKYSYLLPGSIGNIGNMHSIRSSCAVMD